MAGFSFPQKHSSAGKIQRRHVMKGETQRKAHLYFIPISK
jgi:hypothetical protein